jgi:hypothetical protein
LEISIELSFGVLDVIVTSCEGPDYIFDEVGFGFGNFFHLSNDDFIASDAVIILVVNLFVFVGVHVLFVLEVPVLGADSNGDCFVVNSMPDNSAEEFLARAVDFDDAGTNGGQYIPQA